MNIHRGLIGLVVALSFGWACLESCVQVMGGDANTSIANTPIPAIIQSGFGLWSKGGAGMALDTWQKGGLMEGDRKVLAESKYFKGIDGVVGGYKSYELVELQKLGQTSEIIYLTINFERAVVFARFLLFRTEQDWVVQNMDFSTRPETIIPWAAFAGTAPSE